MFLILFFLSQDSSTPLGRPDTESLSQQTLTKLLVQDFDAPNACKTSNGEFLYFIFFLSQMRKRDSTTSSQQETATSLRHKNVLVQVIDGLYPEEKSQFYGKNGEVLPLSQWLDVECDSDGAVTGINWTYKFFSEEHTGSIDLKFLPETVQKFWSHECSLSSVGDLSVLPKNLEELVISHNDLTGVVPFSKLPRSLRNIALGCNQLEGTPDFTDLPENLTDLILYENKFSGPANLSHLPKKLERINLDRNQFWGNIDLTNLPERLEECTLDHNQFSGEVDLSCLPNNLTEIGLTFNQFSGHVHVASIPDECSHLRLHRNTFSGFTIDTDVKNLCSLTIDFPNGMEMTQDDGYIIRPKTRAVNIICRNRGIRRSFCPSRWF